MSIRKLKEIDEMIAFKEKVFNVKVRDKERRRKEYLDDVYLSQREHSSVLKNAGNMALVYGANQYQTPDMRNRGSRRHPYRTGDVVYGN